MLNTLPILIQIFCTFLITARLHLAGMLGWGWGYYGEEGVICYREKVEN